jgi:predicted nucleotidyltransferase
MMVGDMKVIACIEDTAVALDDLPNIFRIPTQIMDNISKMVYYAHAGAGESFYVPF